MISEGDNGKIYSTKGAFAARLIRGDVVTWGSADFGGNSDEVRDRLHNVKSIRVIDEKQFQALDVGGNILATWPDLN